MKTKVVTWLWRQPGSRVAYTDAHVRIWAAMIRRHLTLPHTLAVVTDLPGDYGPDVEIIPPPGDFEDARIPTWRETRPQCHRRLAMFRRDAADIFGADRIVCTDLDLVVCNSLDPLLDIKDDFRIAKGSWRTRAYNGSMMSLRLGSRPQAYEQFTIEAATAAGRKHIGSDQSWLAHCLPGEKVWTPDDGLQFWTLHRSLDSARVVFFAGAEKPWILATFDRHQDVRRHYRGERSDRCLVLGCGPSVWDDVAAALDEGPIGAVIAAPEIARHWPGPVLAVAHDDRHAERLAAMHGFSDLVFCGRQTERIAA